MTDIEDVPNIGHLLAADLRQVDIHSLADLQGIGAAQAWQRLHAAGLRTCLNSRLALEGAVSGVRWTHLDPAVRERIAAEVADAAAESARGQAD